MLTISVFIPVLMVVIFLLWTLGTACYYTKPSTTFQEYAVGNKRFTTDCLVLTVLAISYEGNSLTFITENIYKYGIYWILFTLVSSCSAFWIISWLALRMEPFIQDLSLSETIGKVYGKYARILTTIFCMIHAVFVIALQVKAISFAIQISIGTIPPFIITSIVALIFIWYTAIGGIRIVTITDLVQLSAFFIVFPALYHWTFLQTGQSIQEILAFLPKKENFQLNYISTHTLSIIQVAMNKLSLLMTNIAPPITQRIYMSVNPMQASRVFWHAGIASLLMSIIMALLGIFILVEAPSELPSKAIVDHMVTILPPLLKGCMAISLLAMAMSTADSYLNNCSMMCSQDILEYLICNREIRYCNQLKLAKYIAFLVGLLALFCSVYYNNLEDLITLCLSYFVPTVAAPFILAVIGMPRNSYSALIGMATGLLSILAWNKWIWPKYQIEGSFVCMIVNGFFMAITFYLFSVFSKNTR